MISKRLRGLPIERTLGVLAGRWKAVIVHVLQGGPKRVCELEHHIPGITQKVLIQQLKSLEEHGIVLRNEHGEDSSRVDYALTELGQSLKPVLHVLEEWGTFHAEERDEAGQLLPCEAVVKSDIHH